MTDDRLLTTTLMRSEREQMLAGELHDVVDADLAAARARAHDRMDVSREAADVQT